MKVATVAAAWLPPVTLTGWLRYDLLRRILRATESSRSLLEIGPGVGAFGARVAEGRFYCALEQSRHSAHRTFKAVKARLGQVICGDDLCLSTRAGFDLVCAFEVLEHLEDDVRALRRWSNLMGPDGLLLMSTPAFQARFGDWDERAGHYRRYEPEQLAQRAEDAGLRVLRMWTYGYPFGNLLEFLRHTVAGRGHAAMEMEQRTERSGRAFQPGPAIGALLAGIAFPWRFMQRPFHSRLRGIGLVMLACKAEVREVPVSVDRLPGGLQL